MHQRNRNEMLLMMKIIFLLIVGIHVGNGLSSVAPLYQAAPHSRSGTWIALTTLKTSTDTIPSYTVTFTTPLAANPKLNAITSVSSLDLLSSTQFSFNTSISALSYNGFNVQLQIIGNTYVNFIKFNYIGMSWTTGPSADLLYYGCFLTNDLTYTSMIKNQTFNNQQLVNTVVDGTTFDVQSFITGMSFFNNKDSTKKVSVKSYIANNTNYITQQVSITGNTILQWLCLGTIVIDNNINPWVEKFIVYRMGWFILNLTTASIDMSTFPTGYLPIYNQPDRMFFGLTQVELALGKPYQIIEFKSQNYLTISQGYMSLATGGRMGYLLYANRICNDTAKQLYSSVDQLCWDTCPNGQVKNPTVNICLACHPTCQTCTGTLSTQCSACDGGTNHRTLDTATNQCVCQNLYVQNNVPVCPLCSTFIPKCAICSSKTVCTTCVSSIFVFNSTSIACECAPNTYFIPANNICSTFPGCLSAQVLTNAVYCQVCDTAGHFYLQTSSYTCKCVRNYTFSNGRCIDKCGDGITPEGNSTTYCDDGNLLGGDGCSATCAVEANFGCFVPPGLPTSYCSPMKSFVLKYLWTQRIPNENSAQFIFQVSPSSQQLSSSNFTYYIQSTIPNTIATGTYDPSTSLLRIKIDYLQTVEDQTNTIKITLDPFKMTVPSQSFTVKSSGVNFDLTFDSNAKFNIYLWYIVSVLSGLIVIVSIVIVALNYKIAAVELLLSSQIVQLGVLASIYDNVSLYPLTGFKYLCGFNTLKSFQINKLNYQIPPLLSSGTFAEYLLNFNVTPALLMLIIFIILPLKINVWFKTYQRSKFTSPQMQQKLLINQEPKTSLKQMSTNIKKAQLIVDTFVDRVYFSISLVSYFPLVVYFSYQLAFIGRIGQYQLSSFANIMLSILLLLVDFSFFILIFQDGDKKAKMFNFGSKKLKSYPNRLIMAYFFLVCVFAVVLLCQFALYVLIGLNVLVGVYVWVQNPFDKFSLQHIDSLLKPIISLICLLCIQAMAFFTTQFIAIPIVIISLLFLSMILTIIRTIVVKLRREQNAKRILEEAELDDDIDMDQKQMKNSTDDSQFQSQMNKKLTGKFDTDHSNNKKNKKGGKKKQISDENNLPPIIQNEQVMKNENEGNDSAGELNKDNQQAEYDPDELGDEDEDELTRIKRSLRRDLRKRRGIVNKANEEIGGEKMRKVKSPKKIEKFTFGEDYALKEHHI